MLIRVYNIAAIYRDDAIQLDLRSESYFPVKWALAAVDQENLDYWMGELVSLIGADLNREYLVVAFAAGNIRNDPKLGSYWPESLLRLSDFLQRACRFYEDEEVLTVPGTNVVLDEETYEAAIVSALTALELASAEVAQEHHGSRADKCNNGLGLKRLQQVAELLKQS